MNAQMKMLIVGLSFFAGIYGIAENVPDEQAKTTAYGIAQYKAVLLTRPAGEDIISIDYKPSEKEPKLIKVKINEKGGSAHNTGLVLYTSPKITETVKLKISFDAQSISGSKNLYIGQFLGGDKAGVKLTSKRTEYSVELSLKAASEGIIFTLIGAPKWYGVVKGEFVIGNIKIEKLDSNQKN